MTTPFPQRALPRDLVEAHAPLVERNEQGHPVRVWVSATTGAGIDLLLAAIAERLSADRCRVELRLPPSCGRLRAKLYARGAVESEHTGEDGSVELVVRMPRSDLDDMLRHERLDPSQVLVGAGGLLAADQGDSYNHRASAGHETPVDASSRNSGEVHGLE